MASSANDPALLPAARRSHILADIRSRGASSIRELSERYNVSEMTVRRDLEELAARGVVSRTHGGAMYVEFEAGSSEEQYYAKQRVNEDIKRSLAAAAVSGYVANGDVIIIGGGTTVATMSPYLSPIPNLTVVTNNLVTAVELARSHHPTSTVISVGGIVREVSYTSIGPVVHAFFNEFHANTLFLSSVGYVEGLGFMDPSMSETEAKQAMMKAADRLVMVVDSSKFGRKSLMTSVPLEAVDVLVTDQGAPLATIDCFRERGIEVCIADRVGAAGCAE
jgi:DeoR/GlpR family transcriptional regulator of sugar metabolism